jgi:hypothetical protein
VPGAHAAVLRAGHCSTRAQIFDAAARLQNDGTITRIVTVTVECAASLLAQARDNQLRAAHHTYAMQPTAAATSTALSACANQSRWR